MEWNQTTNKKNINGMICVRKWYEIILAFVRKPVERWGA